MLKEHRPILDIDQSLPGTANQCCWTCKHFSKNPYFRCNYSTPTIILQHSKEELKNEVGSICVEYKLRRACWYCKELDHNSHHCVDFRNVQCFHSGTKQEDLEFQTNLPKEFNCFR